MENTKKVRCPKFNPAHKCSMKENNGECDFYPCYINITENGEKDAV